MKKNKKLNVVISVLLLMALTLTGCSQTPDTSPDNVTTQETTGGKADLVLGTGGTAGTYYVVGAAMGKVVSERSDNVNIVVQSTKGSMENINLTSVGQMQLGMSNADGVYDAYHGTGSYEKAGKQDIVGLMSLYMSAGQMATLKDSGITSYADLKGKKVVLGPPSTTIIEMSKAILREHGVDPENDIKPYYLSFDEGLTKLVDGDVDASFFVAGTPTAAMMNAASTGNVDLIDVDDAVLDKLVEKYPYFEKYTIPANTYKGIDSDVKTLKIMTNIFAKSTISEEAAYEFVKNALEGVEDYESAHKVVQEITPETVWKVPIPLHPGAEKYYREIGVLE